MIVLPKVPGSEDTYAAANVFLGQCFVGGQSFFWPGAKVWSDDALDLVLSRLERFPKGPNVLSRLSAEVRGRHAEAELLTELIVLYHLFPFRTTRDTKVQIVRTFAANVDITLPTDEPWEDCFNQGIGNTGIHYQTTQIRQLNYFGKLAQTLRRLRTDVKNPRDVNRAATEAQSLATGAPESRSALLHLWFPDNFEPIVSVNDKRNIIKTYASYAVDARDLDDKLALIRKELEKQQGRTIQFYAPEIQPSWDPDLTPRGDANEVETGEITDPNDSSVREGRIWIEKTRVAGHADRTTGAYCVGNALWSPKLSSDGRDIYWAMREVQPNDIVLHLTDNSAFTGISIVQSPAEEFVGPEGTDWAKQPALLVRLKRYEPLLPPITKAAWQQEPFASRLSHVAESHSRLFYRSDLNLNQGGYLTECPPELARVLENLYQTLSGKTLFGSLPAIDNSDFIAPLSGFDRLKSITLWSAERLTELIELLRKPGIQVVLAGPPGTSKTWVMRAVIDYLTGGRQEHIRFVQFHPSYTYEQFIEGLRPSTDRSGGLTFSPQPGVVPDFISRMKGDEPYYILIDEINRANLPRVFGELLMLFEYRDEPITLTYSGNFSLPDNLHFVGTMNTADRSIRSVDTAFRRRFDIIECGPDGAMLDQYYEKRPNAVPNLRSGFEALNARLMQDLGRHYQIGHAFFMTGELTKESLRAIWRRKVFPLIEEYFFDQSERLADYRFEAFWPDVGSSDASAS